MGMTADEDRITAIKKAMEDIEERQRPFWEEREKLSDEMTRIYTDRVKRILTDNTKWNFVFKLDQTGWNVRLELIEDTYRETASKVYEATECSEHSYWKINESAQIFIDDGSICMEFLSPDAYLECMKELKLNVSFDDVNDTINTLRQRRDVLMKIAKDAGAIK